MRPAKGSASVLNTKIESGSESAILRSIVSPLWSGVLWPIAFPRAAGEGKISTRKFRIASLPILCSAELSRTGKMRLARDGIAKALLQVFDRKRAFVEKLLHQRVVAFGHQFHERFVRRFRFFGQCRREFPRSLLCHRHPACTISAFIVTRSTTPRNDFFRADGQLDRHHAAPENLLERIERALETRQLAIHPVQHERARLIVFRGVVPDFFGDHLNAGGRVHDDQRGVRGDQRRFCFIDERRIAGRIEQIDFGFFRLPGRLPFRIGEAGVDRNLSRDFFFVPVGDRSSRRTLYPVAASSPAVYSNDDTSWVFPVSPWPTMPTLRIHSVL